MDRMIPPIGTRGRYSLKAPFTTEPNTLYRCAAIREFVDLENRDRPVYENYYQPYDIPEADYRRDRDNKAVIITLVSDTTAPIYVPSSYIAAYPSLSYRNYQHVVLSASIGPIPDYLDLTFAKQQMASILSDTIGVTPEIHVGVAASSGVITPEQHETLETAREAAIVNRTTDRARLLEEQAKNTLLEQKIRLLEQILIDNDLLPT